MVKIALGLGSNINPKEQYIAQAITSLQKYFQSLQVSPFYQTIAYEKKKHEDYYNLAISFDSKIQPLEILKITQKIEQNLGREPVRKKKEPRTIDIDILFYGNKEIQTKKLTIPHYDLLNRDFFLIPLLVLADKNFPAPFQKEKLQQALKKINHHNRTNPILVK